MNREKEVERAQEVAGKQYILKGGLVVNSFVKYVCYLLWNRWY